MRESFCCNPYSRLPLYVFSNYLSKEPKDLAPCGSSSGMVFMQAYSGQSQMKKPLEGLASGQNGYAIAQPISTVLVASTGHCK